VSHSHWPTRFPQSKTHRCPLPKAECDALWTAYLHDHVGLPCHKEIKSGGKVATCTLRGMAKADSRAVDKERQEADFLKFQVKEALRVAQLLKEQDDAIP
jgi:hypothetical protein